MLLLSTKARINRLAGEAAQAVLPASSGSGSSPAPGTMRIGSMQDLYNFFGREGGPRGI